jgi:hypothetical protein
MDGSGSRDAQKVRDAENRENNYVKGNGLSKDYTRVKAYDII